MSSFSFGTPRAQAPAAGGFGFGAGTSPAGTSLSFGSAPPNNVAPANTGFSFGAPRQQAPATGGFGFGSGTNPTPSLSFGGGTATAAPTTTGFSGFGAPATSTASTLGAAATSTGFGFRPAGAPTLGGTAAAAAAAPSGGFSFGAPANPSTSQLGAPPAFGFGGQSTATTAAGTQPQGLFNLSTATGATAQPPSLAPAPVLGLGGVDINAQQPKTVEGKTDGAKAREAQLPQEIAATIETIKAHIKQQKTISSDIARTSQRRLNYVATETQNVKSTLNELADSVETNRSSIKALRTETGHVIHHAEMAQRTHETPPGLQFENGTPLMYFADLVHKFENDLIVFKNQVEMTEKHMRSLANPQSFTGQDLKHGLQQIHECFIALAGRHHEIHQKVEAQKGLYLNLRKYFLNDKTDVFAEQANDAAGVAGSEGSVGVGPTPFSNLLLTLPQTTPSQASAVTSVGGHPTMGGGVGGAIGTTGPSGFGTATNSFSFGNQTDQGFNLQKPPLGGKRNKAFF